MERQREEFESWGKTQEAVGNDTVNTRSGVRDRVCIDESCIERRSLKSFIVAALLKDRSILAVTIIPLNIALWCSVLQLRVRLVHRPSNIASFVWPPSFIDSSSTSFTDNYFARCLY